MCIACTTHGVLSIVVQLSVYVRQATPLPPPTAATVSGGRETTRMRHVPGSVSALHALPQTLNSRESHSSIETRREQEGILEITQFSPRPTMGLAPGHGSLDSSLGAHCAPLSCPLLSPGKDILSLPPWRPFVPSVGERPVSGASTCVWNSGSWGPATRVLLTRSPKDGAPGDGE